MAELLLDTDEEDLAELLLDFAELLLDFAELLEATLDDERAELLDRSSPPSAELRAGSAEDDERTLLLDFALELDFALTEEEDLAELLDTLVSSSLDFGVTLEEDSSSMLLDDSSSRGAKLLSSSPHAARRNATKRNAKLFFIIVLI